MVFSSMGLKEAALPIVQGLLSALFGGNSVLKWVMLVHTTGCIPEGYEIKGGLGQKGAEVVQVMVMNGQGEWEEGLVAWLQTVQNGCGYSGPGKALQRK